MQWTIMDRNISSWSWHSHQSHNIQKQQYYSVLIAKNLEKLIKQKELGSNYRINQEWKKTWKLIDDSLVATRAGKGKLIIPKQTCPKSRTLHKRQLIHRNDT